jgi:hypothetical protein
VWKIQPGLLLFLHWGWGRPCCWAAVQALSSLLQTNNLKVVTIVASTCESLFCRSSDSTCC